MLYWVLFLQKVGKMKAGTDLENFVSNLGFPDTATARLTLKRHYLRGKLNAVQQLDYSELLYRLGHERRARAVIRKIPAWLVREQPPYRYHLFPSSTAHQEIDQIHELQKKGLVWASRFLDIQPPPVISYYFYESAFHKGINTGDFLPGHTIGERCEVHVVHGREKYNLLHEDIHILMENTFGRTRRVFEEGVAIALSIFPQAHQYFLDMCRQHPAYPLENLLDDRVFQGDDTWITYPQAASFVAFLIEIYGIELFKTLYRTPYRDGSFTEVYDRSLPDLEAQWKAFLEKGGGKPAGDQIHSVLS